MAYSIKIKKEVLDKVHQGMSVRAVAKMYMMDNHTIHNWLKSPNHYLGEVRAAHKQHDLEEKIEILCDAVRRTANEPSADAIREAFFRVVPTFHTPEEINEKAAGAEEMKQANEMNAPALQA